jgi:hypothetical protein
VLKTLPGSSHCTVYRDEEAKPAVLVCQVGSAQLTYALRAIDDLHRWLSDCGDWVPLGAADEQKAAADGADGAGTEVRRHGNPWLRRGLLPRRGHAVTPESLAPGCPSRSFASE